MPLIPPSLELEIFIRQEVKEDLNTRDSYLLVLKDWLRQQPHLPDTWDDIRLLNFLRGCSFSLEKCKSKLDSYFTQRTAAPEFHSNRTFKNLGLQHISKLVAFPTLPQLTKNGCRVNFVRINDRNVSGNLDDLIKLVIMMRDFRLGLEESGIVGDVNIIDVETVAAKHFALVTPDLFKKFLINAMKIYPTKIKEIHIINIHPFIDRIYSWLKPFLKKKIVDRIHFHPDGMESLYKFVPQEILPEEYGGKAGKLQNLHNLWMKKLEENEQWFKEQENFKSDESKRLAKLINYEELFGAEGSFKALNID